MENGFPNNKLYSFKKNVYKFLSANLQKLK